MFLYKLFATNITLVWPVPSMGPDMVTQLVLVDKLSFTEITGKSKILYMRSFMYIPDMLSVKSFPTNCAHV